MSGESHTLKRLQDDVKRHEARRAELAKELIVLREKALKDSEQLRQRHEAQRLELDRKHESELSISENRVHSDMKRIEDEQEKLNSLIARSQAEISTEQSRIDDEERRRIAEEKKGK